MEVLLDNYDIHLKWEVSLHIWPTLIWKHQFFQSKAKQFISRPHVSHTVVFPITRKPAGELLLSWFRSVL